MKRHAVQTRVADRRLSFERRSFAYSNHIPERRTGHDRRDTSVLAAVVPTGALSHLQSGGNERSGALVKIVSNI